MRNHSCSSMLSIYGKLHILISKEGGKTIILQPCCTSISKRSRNLIHCLQKNNKNTDLCQRDGKFDGLLQAVLTTPADSLLYTHENQSSAANWLVNADKYLHKRGGLMVSISLVCHKDLTDFSRFSPPFFLEELRRNNKTKIIKIQGVQITNGMHNTTSNLLYQRVLSFEEFKALETITNLQQA